MVIAASQPSAKSERPVRLDLDNPRFWRALLERDRLFLFLDLDGTLVEIARTPQEVSLSPERRRYLKEIPSTPGCMGAIVSGRRMEEVQRLIEVPTLFYVGLHGLDIVTPQGERISYPVDRETIDALQSLRKRFSAFCAGIPGIFLEDKGLSLALHFRLAKRKETRAALTDFLEAIGGYQKRGVPLEILRGKEVVEVKPAGTDKGKAVTHLWKRYGEEAMPIYVGDDVTDEAAFKALRSKGITILVAEAPRPTLARYYLRSPEEVYTFLNHLILRRVKGP